MHEGLRRADPDASATSSASPGTGSLDRLRRRDPDQWERLVEVWQPCIYSWCRQQGLSVTDAQDITQAVFLSLFEGGIDKFRRDSSGSTFGGWLWTVTHRKVLDKQRSLQRGLQAQGGSSARGLLNEVPDSSAPSSWDGARDQAPDDSLFGGVVGRILELARAKVEPRTWKVFERVFFEEAAPDVVAGEFDMTRNAVDGVRHRVLNIIRKLYRELYDVE